MRSPQLLLAVITFSCTCLMVSGCASKKKYSVDEEVVQSGPSGTLAMEIKTVALGIGGASAEGVLLFEDQERSFKMKGVDYGSISASTIIASGEVYHLDSIEDFEGIYFQAKAGFAVGKSGKAGMFLVNTKGVTIHLGSNEEKGIDFTLGRGGMKISFVEEE